jgi:hypothetical protein
MSDEADSAVDCRDFLWSSCHFLPFSAIPAFDKEAAITSDPDAVTAMEENVLTLRTFYKSSSVSITNLANNLFMSDSAVNNIIDNKDKGVIFFCA